MRCWNGTGAPAEEQAREEETAEEKEPPRKVPGKGLAEALSDLSRLPAKSKTVDCNMERFSLVQKNVHTAVSASKHIDDGKKEQSKQTTGDIILKSDIPSRRASGLFLGRCSQGSAVTEDDGSTGVTARDLPVGLDGEGKAVVLTNLNLGGRG